MSDRGLLSRLGTGKRHIDTVQSVTEHLKVMLNTTFGEAETVPDFGMTNLTDFAHELPKGVHKVQQMIREVILKYEPRLRNVSVRFIPSDEPLVLKFEVLGRLNDASRSVLRIRTQVSSNGQFEIR